LWVYRNSRWSQPLIWQPRRSSSPCAGVPYLKASQCRLMAQSRHAPCADECPLLGARRTLTNRCYQSRFMSTRPRPALQSGTRCTPEFRSLKKSAGEVKSAGTLLSSSPARFGGVSVPASANTSMPPRTPADFSTHMALGGSGHAHTINSYPTRAACFADLRDHAVRLMKRRGRHGLC
jgi:hypothetical protein